MFKKEIKDFKLKFVIALDCLLNQLLVLWRR